MAEKGISPKSNKTREPRSESFKSVLVDIRIYKDVAIEKVVSPLRKALNSPNEIWLFNDNGKVTLWPKSKLKSKQIIGNEGSLSPLIKGFGIHQISTLA